MNIATIIGFLVGVAVLVYATFSSTESVLIFLNLPGLAIVFGGTFAATFICYPLKELLRVFAMFSRALRREELPIGHYIREIIYLANQAASQGRLKLHLEIKATENYFLQEGLQMLVDGYPAEEMEAVLRTRIENTYRQEMAQARIFRTMAKLSPAFGITGTLIGLISMMQSMGGGSFEQIGPGMAVALVTTFYGLLLANLIFLPIAVKVESSIEERVLLMNIITDGLLLIQAKMPPPMILDKLKAYLPPRRWASIRPRQKAKKTKVAVEAKARRRK